MHAYCNKFVLIFQDGYDLTISKKEICNHGENTNHFVVKVATDLLSALRIFRSSNPICLASATMPEEVIALLIRIRTRSISTCKNNYVQQKPPGTVYTSDVKIAKCHSILSYEHS